MIVYIFLTFTVKHTRATIQNSRIVWHKHIADDRWSPLQVRSWITAVWCRFALQLQIFPPPQAVYESGLGRRTTDGRPYRACAFIVRGRIACTSIPSTCHPERSRSFFERLPLAVARKNRGANTRSVSDDGISFGISIACHGETYILVWILRKIKR